MNCKKAGIFMMKHMDGELSAEDYDRLLSHLNTCANCAEDFAAYRSILNEFENINCLVDAPEGFEQCVMKKIEHLEPEESRSKNDTIVTVLIVGVLSVLLGSLVMFGGIQAVENALSALPYAIDIIVGIVIQNGFLLFFIAATLIVSPAVIRRQMMAIKSKQLR